MIKLTDALVVTIMILYLLCLVAVIATADAAPPTYSYDDRAAMDALVSAVVSAELRGTVQ